MSGSCSILQSLLANPELELQYLQLRLQNDPMRDVRPAETPTRTYAAAVRLWRKRRVCRPCFLLPPFNSTAG